MGRGTLRSRFIPQLLVIVLALIAFMLLYHLKATKLLRDQSAYEGTRLCGIYVHEIDVQLDSIGHWP